MPFSVLVSSNEWERVGRYIGDEGVSVALPFDFQMFYPGGAIAAERKRAPADLLVSVEDGRLARECAAMREEAQYRFLIVERTINYDKDDHVSLGRRQSHWTRAGIRNLLRSIRFVDGVEVEFSTSILDTVCVLREIHNYFNSKGGHGSYKARPTIQTNWPVTQYGDRYLYWLQGLPGTSLGRSIGPTHAKQLASVFPNPQALFSASFEQIMSAKGVGEKTARAVYGFFHDTH